MLTWGHKRHRALTQGTHTQRETTGDPYANAHKPQSELMALGKLQLDLPTQC